MKTKCLRRPFLTVLYTSVGNTDSFFAMTGHVIDELTINSITGTSIAVHSEQSRTPTAFSSPTEEDKLSGAVQIALEFPAMGMMYPNSTTAWKWTNMSSGKITGITMTNQTSGFSDGGCIVSGFTVPVE